MAGTPSPKPSDSTSPLKSPIIKASSSRCLIEDIARCLWASGLIIARQRELLHRKSPFMASQATFFSSLPVRSAGQWMK